VRQHAFAPAPCEASHGCDARNDDPYPRDLLAIDLPNEDAPTPMNRVNKPIERSSLPRPQANPVLGELLECLHSRFHWQRIVIVAIDQDAK
jgi:hypothetical protein